MEGLIFETLELIYLGEERARGKNRIERILRFQNQDWEFFESG